MELERQGGRETDSMKKCSYCGAEYPDDAVMCPIDRTRFDRPVETPLAKPDAPVETSGPKYHFPPLSASDMQKDFVTLVSCGTLSEADLIVGRLEVAGINAFIPDAMVMQMMTGDQNAFGYIRVQVAPKDYDSAKELLSDIYGTT